MPERCADWPAESTLILADLHLGKADALAASDGAPVPEHVARGVLRDDLARLARALERSGAQRVVIVGDLLHAHAGLTAPMIDDVARWRDAHPHEWVLVRGNHDGKARAVAHAWRLTLAGERWDHAGLTFEHIPPAEPVGGFVVSGHEHPAVAFTRAGQTIKLPAFVVGPTRLILPAFSRFTGGVARACRPDDRLFACAPGEVFEAPNPWARGRAGTMRA
ncbi:MAG: ligase-associated DNA damage response endonuclease PdeM [Phycisphaeraceae bacterium]|nr:MAG: ligase-associated DNA damage response endonuclease PdeM [Phycisphaeraceae bacterium]